MRSAELGKSLPQDRTPPLQAGVGPSLMRPPAVPVGGEPGLLSIVIKTLNEEAKIARAIESALACAVEIAPLRLEVVVADSASDDRTADVAANFPVRLVRMSSRQDRGCGAAVQLGFEWSRGEWVYLMDGDMCLKPGFLSEALALLLRDPRLAAVGGLVVDERVANDIDRIRVNNRSVTTAGDVRWLGGGGLYRRLAIARDAGYAADRNLRGYEEADLGLRLGASGWRLHRLARPAVSHLGHDAGTWELLLRHWRSGRALAGGVLLRGAYGRPWWSAVLRLHVQALLAALWWLLLASLALSFGWKGLMAWAVLSVACLLTLALRKRDLRHAAFSVFAWHYSLAGLVLGWFQPRVRIHHSIPAYLLREAGGESPATR